MQAEDVVSLYTLLLERDVQVWVDGGWGVDALLERQTRPHKDLDALVRFDDLATLAATLADHGFTLKEIWSENRWVAHPLLIPLIGRVGPAGCELATAFVLCHTDGQELDFHALRFDQRGYGIPAWDTDFVYPPDAFEGRGTILGTLVRCLSAEIHMITHTGYTLKAKDLQDLRFLHKRFGVAYLKEQAHLFPEEER